MAIELLDAEEVPEYTSCQIASAQGAARFC